MAGATAMVAGAGLRVARMVAREQTLDAALILQAWLVSCAYDLGRALAVIVRIPHRNDTKGIATR
jgi:hypothetical protein